MLILLSPAKNLDYSPPSQDVARTTPRMVTDIVELSKVAAKLARADIAQLMDLSEKLADLNWHRFQAFGGTLDGPDTLQAALAFNGDVYQGLSARTLTAEDLDWAQERLRILSGLYGVIRPLDAIAPYRLEMGTRLKTERGHNLYEFWGSKISAALNADLVNQDAPTVINLASTEYFSAVDKEALKARTITCHFKETKDGDTRIVSFYAKRARGLMARYAITNRVSDPNGLKDFDSDGYRYDSAASTPDTWIFTRAQPARKKS
jgi:cytoplasmic iron level regulating protein YaaA (DUF328/UPF0246 family)